MVSPTNSMRRGQAALPIMPLPDAALARVATGEGSYNESVIEGRRLRAVALCLAQLVMPSSGGPIRPNLPLVPSFEESGIAYRFLLILTDSLGFGH
eukprot:Skav219626  [mRNA]  locus=scaffold628:202544:202928:- [translate_table: standard]